MTPLPSKLPEWKKFGLIRSQKLYIVIAKYYGLFLEIMGKKTPESRSFLNSGSPTPLHPPLSLILLNSEFIVYIRAYKV